MNKEHPAFRQWKTEGETPDAVQAMQDARANFAEAQKQLRALTGKINALTVAYQTETDPDKKSELGFEFSGLQATRAEVEKIISDYEREFEGRSISLDKPTIH